MKKPFCTLQAGFRTLLPAFFVLSFMSGTAQTIIIDSTSTTGGSFQNTTNTFPANGWTVVNAASGSSAKWFISTISSCVGSKGAYVGTANTNNTYNTSTSSVSHFYMTVSFPAGQSCIVLSFNWKGNGETGYDGMRVYAGSVGGAAPVANTVFSSTDPGATQLGTSYEIQTSCGRVSLTLPSSFAGTTRKLVFSWVNDNSGGNGTGATVDNISLISDNIGVPPNCIGTYSPANLSVGITPCNPTLTWSAPAGGTPCTAPTQYYIYFGPSSNPPLIDSTAALSYTLGSLSNLTAYYWRVVPANAQGIASGCTQHVFTTGTATCTASPGGAGTAKLTAWFKADALPAGNVASWSTSYPTGGSAITLTDPGSPYAQSVTGNTASNNWFNYNRYVSFANNSTTAGNDRYLYSTGDYALLTNSNNTGDQGSFFTTFHMQPGGTNDAITYWKPASGNYGLQCRAFRMAIGSGLGLSTNSSRDYTFGNNTQYIFSYTGNRSTSASMEGYSNGSPLSAGTASECAGSTGLAMGIHLATGSPAYIEPFQGGLAEDVFFNITMTDQQLNRVHSYLALKYGTTLSTRYSSADNTVVYSTAAPYNNNIIGIARDDASGLLQKQSHNADDSVRIYAATLAATNAANTASFASDRSFVVMGATNGQLNATAGLRQPAGIYSRLEREWQVTKTNFGQTFSIDITLSPFASARPVLVSDLRLLVDNTGDFANATVYAAGSGLTFSYNAPVVTISGISNTQIPNNSTYNITLASVSVTTVLPSKLTGFAGHCDKKDIVVNWNTVSEEDGTQFILERAESDSLQFSPIAQLKGRGNGTLPAMYSYTDRNAVNYMYYYRVRMTDKSGNNFMSPITIVRQDCIAAAMINSLSLYPNPAEGHAVVLDYRASVDEPAKIQFRNTTGQICLTLPVQIHAGSNTVPVNIGQLKAGVYFVQLLSSRQQNNVLKLIVTK
ncbi:MAG: T9SS type A sorting domain-containing protein [Bacteroidetes bacterium]|nr:T9SS type A sorting domain-containing protein [Bacteroidota bacterium]